MNIIGSVTLKTWMFLTSHNLHFLVLDFSEGLLSGSTQCLHLELNNDDDNNNNNNNNNNKKIGFRIFAEREVINILLPFLPPDMIKAAIDIQPIFYEILSKSHIFHGVADNTQ